MSAKAKNRQIKPKKKRISKDKIKRNVIGWLLMIPSLILFVFFVFLPLIKNIDLSFYSTVGFEKNEFVGFQNYIEVFNDPRFKAAFGNTFRYAGWSIIIGFFIPIILGIALSELLRFKALFRIGIYLPSIISGMAVVILFSFLFDPNANAPLNSLLRTIGLNPSLWLDNPGHTIPLIVVTMTWRGAGGTALIYLSNVQNVRTDLYEAARLEGANVWQRIRYITLPHLKPLIQTMFIMQMISVLQVFYEPLVMTKGGGPGTSSLTLMLLSYQYAFEGSITKPAHSAAVGVILSLFIILMTVLYFAVIKRQKKGERR